MEQATMTAVSERAQPYLELFGRLDAERREPAWLAERRAFAIERFSVLGFPTTRHEEYKYTNLARLARSEMQPAEGGAVSPQDLQPAEYEGLSGPRLVFVDGRFREELSSTGAEPGVQLTSLAAALEAEPQALEGHLTRYAEVEDHALAALNTALFADGAFVRIADKAVVANPVHIVYVSSGQAGRMSCPRTLILAGSRSQAQVIESFISLADGAAWTNAVTEIVAEDGARLEHFKAQQESREAFHTGLIQMLEERNAYVSTISLSFGAALTRNDVNMVLNDEGAECALDGLFVVSGKQHVDHHTTIDHARAHCNSHQLYKGVLGGEAKGVFNGKIIVRQDAQKTDAIQNNKNLLLSDKAEINTKPQLEIDANDVRCTHGATIGQLDSDALFYLQSRGIGRDHARGLLTFAFAADLLARVKVEPLRLHFERELLRTLSRDPAAGGAE